MNEEEELGGRFAYSILFLSFFSLLSCGEQSSDQKFSEQVIINTCGDDFPAAAYYLADRKYLFSHPDLFPGQPINYFSEVLTEDEKQLLEDRFLNTFKEQSSQDQKEVSNQFLRWCESNKLINKLELNLSSEEVFLHLSQSPILSSTINDILPNRSQTSNGDFTLEDFATLSSAEFHDIHQKLLTALSKMSNQEYKAAKADVQSIISMQK